MDTIKLPDLDILIKNILSSSVKSEFKGEFKNIEEWRKHYLDEIKKYSSYNDVKKFNLFVFGGLLMQSVKGEIGERLERAANEIILNFEDIKPENIEEVFKQSGFRLRNRRSVPLDFLNIFTKRYNRDWDKYFDEAQKNYKENFIEDNILKVNGVGFKTRDLALSCFLKEYSANDFHVIHVLTRTGLILYGFGDLNFGTNPRNDKNYLFLRYLMIKFSKQIGCSPGELDRIFWHFGRAVCKNKPDCDNCPIKDFCLTGKNIKKI
ncbi:MAG: hypothetical protein NTX55_02340 [Candidatus Parcubacteria bacterium]|nr:hypothetical protein [Candidatus Parcubacteria bacterium]